MPRYEFRCRACGDTFDVDRPMEAATEPALCPDGHSDTVKLLTTAGSSGRAGSTGAGVPAPAGGGGCCGGGCCS
ncbi:putative FmdB family regulatory protein [Allocatelliglobosispora scoriae]|uniref:Putative FmdB family regulatory protein n=1 Tax=Allocatelliglobosispora scoriae TaxID=643052 RepID=A0A841BVH7_9ACTN|nr:zinc ribbon domain-containing protein [Allocatelliglobosispora scoriae]MBB5871476.1 putative FmdB family regulatory protein [Allocatelliglobosispora scoriae]